MDHHVILFLIVVERRRGGGETRHMAQGGHRCIFIKDRKGFRSYDISEENSLEKVTLYHSVRLSSAHKEEAGRPHPVDKGKIITEYHVRCTCQAVTHSTCSSIRRSKERSRRS